jgi:hypothetical protein
MNPTTLNDREQQVCKTALLLLLTTKAEPNAVLKSPINQFDIIATNHTRAHCITALKKFGIDFATLQKAP